ncbi:PREDICTED: proteasome assembly chaperone 4-like [Eufriesea mexicana]|uniref:proteasome assembly chaperone 4-like n=1 Tax=Eufriesea mexicana TaxID=516756 RepID=UPI00083BF87A|nr:PREDICTED: proteasome assembly chaperone 4-like [Eufriesea mexicana]
MESQLEEEIKDECSFKFHDFVAKIGDSSIAYHTIKMKDCLYVWIGDFQENAMNDLAFAIKSTYEKEPLATKIMGSITNEVSNSLAKRLSKRLSVAVYVSFNVQVDNLSLPAIERRLRDEINAHPEVF